MITERLRGAAFGLALLMSAVVAAAPQVPSPEPSRSTPVVRIDGSNGILPLAGALRRALHEHDESIEIALGGGLPGPERLEALADRSIDIALASHGLDLAELARRGMTAHRIALTPVVFAVHSDVAVRDLTSSDVCRIFAGEVTNWRELGGADLAVKAFMRPETEVDTEIVRAGIPCMKAITFPRTVTRALTTGEMLASLQSTKGAIGITTSTVVRQSIVALRALSLDSVAPTPDNVTSGRYALARPAYFVTLASPSTAVARFIEFVRSERGAAVIAANGALPVP